VIPFALLSKHHTICEGGRSRVLFQCLFTL
jgi:hypothetical protein